MKPNLKRPRGISSTPFRAEAIRLGLLAKGERSMDNLPLNEYCTICRLLNDMPRNGRGIREEIGHMVARAVLTGTKLIRTITFICVSDYVGGVRYREQNGIYAMTKGEQEMLEGIIRLRIALSEMGYTLEWRLILADAWGLELYPERLVEGAVEKYCAFMTELFGAEGEIHRWTELMEREAGRVEEATRLCQPAINAELLQWESTQGEIAHDKPGSRELARHLSRRHIEMRAIEGWVLVDIFGPMIVLSTEDRGARRYDNLVVPHASYSGINWMPYNPHRL